MSAKTVATDSIRPGRLHPGTLLLATFGYLSQRTRFVQGDFIMDAQAAPGQSSSRNGLDSSRATSSGGELHHRVNACMSQRTRFVQGDFIRRCAGAGFGDDASQRTRFVQGDFIWDSATLMPPFG